MDILIRKGEEKDLPGVLALINELAEYEKAPHEVTITLEQLRSDGFGNRKLFEFIVAVQNERVIGMAFYFFRYSTWKGKFLYLEDFIVSESHRRQGVGESLFKSVMKLSIEENCVGMSWQVLDWNQPALNFYRKFNAVLDAEWVNGRLLKDEMIQLIR